MRREPALEDTLAGTFGADNMGQSLARMDGDGERRPVDRRCSNGHFASKKQGCRLELMFPDAGSGTTERDDCPRVGYVT
jgi:hypothetical protein